MASYNSYLIFILISLSFFFVIETAADIMNATRLSEPLPAEFEGVYDRDQYQKSLSYQKEKVRLTISQRTTDFVLLVCFIFLGGFNHIDVFVRSYNFNPIFSGIFFAFSLFALKFLFSLPFTIYNTFVLEEKYGFNKTTLPTFLSDTAKGIVIGMLLGSLVFAGLIYFFDQLGTNAWLYAWTAFTLFQLLLLYLAPALILPLFNRFTPLAEGELKKSIYQYAEKQKFSLRDIFTMDSSKRTSKGNAFFTGFGRFRKLVLFDTLIDKQTNEELVAILAHEIGHFKCSHILKTISLSFLTTAFSFYVFGFFLNNQALFEAFQMDHVSVYASLVLIGFLSGPVLGVTSIATQYLSRKHEYEADAYAVKSCENPKALISALKKLSIDSMSHLTPHPFKVFLEYSHPPILTRIEAIKRILTASFLKHSSRD